MADTGWVSRAKLADDLGVTCDTVVEEVRYWIPALDAFGHVVGADGTMEMMLSPDSNWKEGEQFVNVDGVCYVDLCACKKANVEFLRSYRKRLEDKTTYLYRHYDDAGMLLYVGISCALGRRTSEHEAEADWWDDVAYIDIERFYNRKEAAKAERRAIRDERPLCNIAHKTHDAAEH